MYPAGTALQGPPRPRELGQTPGEAPAQTQVHSRRHGFGKATTLPQRFSAPPPECQRGHSTRHERLGTARPAPTNLPDALRVPRGPTTDWRLSVALGTQRSELPGARTIPARATLRVGGSTRVPLPLCRS